jgi:hypothetical protein
VERRPDASRTARGSVWLPALTAALAPAGSGASPPDLAGLVSSGDE